MESHEEPWRAGEPDSRKEPLALMPVLIDSVSQVRVLKISDEHLLQACL